MRLEKEKCLFCLPKVEYLGHSISAEGLCQSMTKVKAITDALEPSKVSEFKSFLGLVSYYAKFIPNLATTLAPFTSYWATLSHGNGRRNSNQLLKE